MIGKSSMHIPSNRSFGTLFVVVFVLFAVRQALRGVQAWVIFWLVSAVVLAAFTLIRPSLLTPFNRAWMWLGEQLHRIVSPIVLGVMYGVMIAPVGLIMRLVGRDSLRLKPVPWEESHWLARESTVYSSDRFKNQF